MHILKPHIAPSQKPLIGHKLKQEP